MKKTLLLHSCCGPCSTAVIERLLDDYRISVYYYNPNIHPQEEYEHRKNEQKRFIDELCKNKGVNIEFIEGDYEPSKFFECAKGLEAEKEGGRRCSECFFLRLDRTASLAANKGFDFFDTTLSVSPHKNYQIISETGKRLEEKYGVCYLAGNYKKQDGFKRSIDLSKEYNLYRQNYCGCIFSKRD